MKKHVLILTVAMSCLPWGAIRASEPDKSKGEWGDAVEGLQCRLRIDEKSPREHGVPALKADVRNDGKRDLSIAQTDRCQLEWDGVWFEWGGGRMVPSSWFPPERSYEDIPITFTHGWFEAFPPPWYRTGAPILKPTSGKHTIRVAFTANPHGDKSEKDIRFVSNPIVIDVKGEK